MPTTAWLNSLTPEERAEYSRKLSAANVARHASMSSSEKLQLGENISKGLAAMAPERASEMRKSQVVTRKANETPAQRVLINKHNSESQLHRLATETPEQKAERGDLISIGLRRHFACQTGEQREAFGKAISVGIRAWQACLSEVELVEHHDVLSRAKHAFWESLTIEEYDAFCKVLTEAQALRSPEEKAETNLKVSRSIRAIIDARTKEEKQAISKKLSVARGLWWSSLSDEEKNKYIKDCKIGTNNTQTYPELLIEGFLNLRQPSKWKYNGQGQADIRVGGKCPDFVHTKNKWAINEHGVYWHSIEDEEADIKYYAKRGWKLYVIWDYDTFSEIELDKMVKFFEEVS
jgi:G:T-mismatch repair DNA endonuclease (very short patch repair protein)